MLGVVSQWAPVAVRCVAFQCIGDLIYGHRQNLDVFASKSLDDEREVEPALNSILQIILRTSSMQEFIAADCISKSFCESKSREKLSQKFIVVSALLLNLRKLLRRKKTTEKTKKANCTLKGKKEAIKVGEPELKKIKRKEETEKGKIGFRKQEEARRKRAAAKERKKKN